MWPLPQAVPEPLKNGEGGEHHTTALLAPRQAECHCWDVFSFVFIYRELLSVILIKQMNAGNSCLVLTPVLYLCRPWGRGVQGPVQQLLIQDCSKQQCTSCFGWSSFSHGHSLRLCSK